ncbi:hypothetical protein TorRG33x02_188630, partial [Trema orientale]
MIQVIFGVTVIIITQVITVIIIIHHSNDLVEAGILEEPLVELVGVVCNQVSTFAEIRNSSQDIPDMILVVSSILARQQ